jgi:hypothetical protein
MEQVAVTAQAPAPILNHAQTNGDAVTAPKNAPPGDAVSDAPRKRKSRLDDDDDRPRKKKSRRDEDDEDDDSPRKKKSRRDEDEEDDDQPRKKKSRRDEDEEDDDQPRKKKSRRDDDEDDDDPPARSKKRNDDDDDEDDRPRKKSKRKNKKSKKGSKVFILVGAIGGGALLIGLIVLLFLFIPFGSASGISAEALRFIPKDADSIDGYTIPTSGQPAIILRKTKD